MKILNIVTYPEKILKRRAGEIQPSSDLHSFISQMIDAMYSNDGIGLAAPQVGVSKRIIIVETSKNPREHKQERRNGISGTPAHAQGKPLAFLNPNITGKSKETDIQEEGCLSLPGLFVPVKRAQQIELSCQTAEAKIVKIEAKGLIARIFQHEIDHLNGKLIIDHQTPIQRLKLRKQLNEIASNTHYKK